MVLVGREKVCFREPALSLNRERSMMGMTRSSRRLRSKAEAEQRDKERSSDWVRVDMSMNGRESMVPMFESE